MIILKVNKILESVIFIFMLMLLSGCMTPSSTILIPKQEKISEEQFHEKIRLLDKFSAPVLFERTQDGFKINNQPFIDKDGKIKDVRFNQKTGLVNYLVYRSNDSYYIKILQASRTFQPLIIARITLKNNFYSIYCLTGETLFGNTLILGSTGFILVQNDGNIIDYDYIKGLKHIQVPKGYQIDEFQNGDFSSTGLILLQRFSIDSDQNSSVFMTFLKKSKYYLGFTDYSEFSLFNFETGKLIRLNISNDGSTGKICSKYIGRWNDRRCIQYDNQINPYSKSLEWVNESNGVVVITSENDAKELYETNLITMKKVLLQTSKLKLKGFKINLEKDTNMTVIPVVKGEE